MRSAFITIVTLSLFFVTSSCKERAQSTQNQNQSQQQAASSSTANSTAGSPLRVVALSPALAQIIRDLGASNLLVGRHGFDSASDQSIPVCGDQSGIDTESLIRQRPTHLFTQLATPPASLPAALSAVRTQNFRLLSLADVRAAITALGDQLAEQNTASELLARFNAALAPSLSPTDRVSLGPVLLLYSTDPPTVLGPGSFHHEILLALGALSASTADAPFITLDAEGLARIAPSAIILIHPRNHGSPPAPTDWPSLQSRLGSLASLNIPAITSRRVMLIDDPLAAVPGSNLISLAEQMRSALAALAHPPAPPAPLP